jgi:lipopolysaccharide exporter
VKSDRATLKARTLSALSWSAATQVSHQALRFGISIVLARLLSPAEFGLFAMLAVFTGFAKQFGSLGFGASLVQKQDVRAEHLDTVFWVNIATGLVLAAILAACAPLIAAFYGEPILIGITVVFGLNFVISSLNVVQSAILQKKLDFRRLFWLDFFATVAGGSVAITLALKGFGVWTLVFDMLIATTVRVLVMWITSGWRPRLRFDTSALRELFGFSGNLMASNAVTYWSRNFDTLLVGKYFGDVSAGIYNRAYQLMMLPMTQVTAVITRVMFPALAAIQNDVPRVRTVYLRATRIISLVTFPLMMLLMVLAEPTILFLYGEKWRASVPLFQILCVAAIAQSVGTTVSWIYSSQGRTDIQFKWILIATPLRITSFIVGIQWGVMGMTIAYVLTGYLITFYPSWSIPGRLIGLKFSEMVRNILPTFGCGVATAVLVWAIDILLLPPTFYPLRLAVGGSIGILAYLALLNAFHVQAWRDVSELVHGGHLPAARHITRFLPKYRTP